MKDARSHLIVAVDVPDRAAALAVLDRLSGHVGWFKLGLEVFTREGPALVEEFVGRGAQVFLDLKLHDIPNTVAAAVRSACRLGAGMLTVHAAGGRKMLEAARDAAQSVPVPPMLLAITVLTSLSQDDAAQIGILDPVAVWAEKLAVIASEAGIPGLVTSPHELPGIYSRFGGTIKFVVPGIRPGGAARQDQVRTATPGAAISAGADYLVVGRPILQAPDPSVAADAVVEEISKALLRKEKG
jgi:orotidine-5'-phosphate decarboxylase